jgi:HAD superfamily hydrolase (TIGR01490 family)
VEVRVPSDVRAALFDIDGTLTTGKGVWGPLVRSPDVQPARKIWLYATAMPHYALSKGHIVSQAKFRDRWVRLMAWLMTGWSSEAVEAMYREIVFSQLVPDLRADVVSILKEHRQQGRYVVLVSTMFEGIVQELARFLEANAGLGSRVALRDGRCLGKIVGSTCSGERKLLFAREHLAQTAQASLAECAAYADSRSDVPLLSGVGHPVAVYPDSAMGAHAQANGWPIINGA